MDEKGGFPNMPFLITLGFVAAFFAMLAILLTVVGLVLLGN